jgi:hypothetical protein
MKIQNQVTPNTKKNIPILSTNFYQPNSLLTQILNQTLAPEPLPIETIDVQEEMPALIMETPQPEADSTPVVSDLLTVDEATKENDIDELGKFEMINNPLDPENKKGYYMDMEFSDPEEGTKVADETGVTLDSEADLDKEQVDLYYQETNGEKGTEVEAGMNYYFFFGRRACIFF